MLDKPDNRFVDRTMTVQEVIWQRQGADGDLEALVFWLESRLAKEHYCLDIRMLPETDLPSLVAECLEGCRRAAEVSVFLESLEKQMEE